MGGAVRCLIFLVAEGYRPAELTIPVWTRYAHRYGHDLRIVRHHRSPGVTPHWDRYAVFEHHPDYDRYLYVDADTLPHPTCPDLFATFPDTGPLYAVPDAGGLAWLYGSMETYGPLFGSPPLAWERYFNSGVLLFAQHHRTVFKQFLRFRSRHWTALQRQLREARRLGRVHDEGDQTLLNYFLQVEGCPVQLIPGRWNLQHVGWRGGLHQDAYLKMGNIFHFCGLNQEQVLERVRHTLQSGGYEGSQTPRLTDATCEIEPS